MLRSSRMDRKQVKEVISTGASSTETAESAIYVMWIEV